MRFARSNHGTGRIVIPALLGWIFATFLVAVAVFGPPLTGQSAATLVELRHDILMIDREFGRSSIRTNTSSFQTSTLVFDDFRRASRSTGSKIPVRGDAS